MGRIGLVYLIGSVAIIAVLLLLLRFSSTDQPTGRRRWRRAPKAPPRPTDDLP